MNRLQRFLYGRYGTDQLGIFLLLAGIVTAMISALTGWWMLRLISWGAYFFCLFRVLSKNILRRRRENEFFLQKIGPVKRWGKLQKMRFSERNTHRYFVCPKCRQQVRVPKGKGKIRIICPKCREEFIRKS